MRLKGAGPYFQRSMSNTVLAGLVYQICELYIDDVLIHDRDIESFLANVRKVFERLREFNVAVNPAKTKLGLAEVEYVFMITNGKVRVVRFFSKALVGAQLNWSVIEKKCYGIFYGVRLFEDLLDNRPFILNPDHKNLTYLNVTLTGKVLRWKLYLQDKDFYLCHVPGKEVHQGVPDALPRLCDNHMPVKQDNRETVERPQHLSALQVKQEISDEKYKRIATVHNSNMGHWGHALTKRG